MEVMAMENNELKEKVRMNVKEKIAIANIQKEFANRGKHKKKTVYAISSICAVVILSLGILVSTGQFTNVPFQKQVQDLEEKQNHEENQKIEIEINTITNMAMTTLDADVQTIEMTNLPKKLEFVNQIKVPEGYSLENSYQVYVKTDPKKEEYDLLHDFVFNYRKDSSNIITLACSELETPLRDYLIEEKGKVSKIGEVDLIIYQYERTYMVTFQWQGIYFDLETTGLTKDEFVDLLQSIIEEMQKATMLNQTVEEKATNVKEEPKEIENTAYPEYYAGKYVDKNGQNVILLCQDTKTNREQICTLFGITEEETIFQEAVYSYSYLMELQSKITEKMQKKEASFIISSALMEDQNKIKITIISREKEDWDQLKDIDPIGGAIEIQYSEDLISKEDLLVNAE